MSFLEPAGHGVPPAVTRIASLMASFSAPWALVGGWAVDAWLGRITREHQDIDVSIFREDERALFDLLHPAWRLVAHDAPDAAHDEPWDGRPLRFPAHIHATAEDGFALEVLVNMRAGADWVLDPALGLALPIAQAVTGSPWGVPTAVPAVIAFYKATAYWQNPNVKPRRFDEADFAALAGLLPAHDRQWLAMAVSRAVPGHPWLGTLSP